MSKSSKRLAAAGAREALLEQRPELADVLGREQRRDPAVGDLGRQRRVLRPDRREVDRDPLLHRRDRELQRLAGPVGQRQLERLAVVDSTRSRASAMRTTSTYSRVRWSCLPKRWPCQPSATCGPLEPMPEQHPPVGELVERRGGHRGHRRRAAGHLEDRRAELDPLGLPREPGEDRGGVGAVGLGGPHRVVAEPLGLQDELELLLARSARGPSNRCARRVARFRSQVAAAPRAYGGPVRKARDPISRLRPQSTACRADARGDARGIRATPIIVGAYTDGRGGVCPMLAATAAAAAPASSRSPARGTRSRARGRRRATERELRTLEHLLVASLAEEAKTDLGAAIAEHRRRDAGESSPGAEA